MKLTGLGFSVLCWFGIAASAGDVYPFSLAAKVDPVAERPRVKAIGELMVNGRFRLPAFQIIVRDPLTKAGWLADGPGPRSIRGHLDAGSAAQLVAYHHPNGWILVPKGWEVIHGQSGVDGSAGVTFAPPSGVGYLSYYTSGGACEGCAQMPASIFFPEARRKAQDNDRPWYSGTNVPLKAVRIRPHLMAYRVVLQEQPIDGLAYYNEDPDCLFYKVEVTLPPALRALATPILNWFLPPK